MKNKNCIYFNGIQNNYCKKKINYEELTHSSWSDVISVMKRIPCISNRDNIAYYCPYRELKN